MATPSAPAQLAGELIRPRDPEYDAARAVYNGMIDRRPALIARCAGPEDVQRIVRFAREGGVPLAVRGGGHSAGSSRPPASAASRSAAAMAT